jgi:protein SCO1
MTSSAIDRRALLTGISAAAALVLPDARASAQGAARDPLAARFGGPFALTDHTGSRVTERDFLGEFMLIYFGFTRCVDACPIDVPNLVHALEEIAPLDRHVRPIFITVDPADTPQALKDYVSAFHPRLVGLTGDEGELAAVAKAYRVHRYKVQRQTSAGPRHWTEPPGLLQRAHGGKAHAPGQTFTIDHGTLTYLMGRDGKFLTLIPHGAKPSRIAGVLRKYVTA